MAKHGAGMVVKSRVSPLPLVVLGREDWGQQTHKEKEGGEVGWTRPS